MLVFSRSPRKRSRIFPLSAEFGTDPADIIATMIISQGYWDMKLQLMIAAATAALSFAGMATAQGNAAETEWGDGAAYGGGRIIQGGSISGAPTKLATPTVAGNSMSRSATPISKNDQFGECFARITIPATYRTDKREVVVQDAHKTLSFTPPEFEQDVVRVKTRDEYVRYKVRQPRWEVETEEIITRPEYERLTVRPAQWRFVDETVDISQPKLTWKAGKFANSDITRTDPVTGTVFTLIEEAGETRTYRKRVMAAPEQVSARTVPAKYLTVTKRVLTDPGGVDTENVPAEFREYNVQRLAKTSQPQENNVPSQIRTIETEIMIAPERWNWTPVLCGDRLTADAVAQLQSKLSKLGHYSGKMDGQLGPQTKTAVRAFQKTQNLPHGGELTLMTLERLGAAHLIKAATR